MEVMYRVRYWCGIVIRKVEVERKTESSVFIRGRRSAKRSEAVAYFDTLAEAKDSATSELETKINDLRKRLKAAEAELDAVCKLQESSIEFAADSWG
jgi:molecular chaperone GrpE (heat shock protein)